MKLFRRLKEQAFKEPLALFAVLLTALGFIYERDFFQRWLRVEPTVTAYHVEQHDGRCPLVAFEVVNEGSEVASNIRISILEDWITARGDEDLFILTFEEALMEPGADTAMKRRDPLNVEAALTGNVFSIPQLQPGEYVQRLLLIRTSANMAEARRAMADDPEDRTRPRIAQATYDGGRLDVERNGECLQ